MRVHFVLPDKAAGEINGFLGRQVKRYELAELTAEKVIAAHKHFGAIVYTADPVTVREVLGLPEGFAGVRLGITPSEYAKRIGKSRSWICQQIKKGAIKADRVGPWVAVTQ